MDRRKRICICGHPITVHSQEGTCRLSDCPCLNFRFQRTADAPVTQIAKNALAALTEAGEGGEVMPTLDEAWRFYMSTVPPDDRYDTPSGDFCSGYVQGKAAGAAAKQEQVLAIVKEESNRPFTLSNTPQNQGYMEGCSDTCDEITRRIRQRGEEGE